MSERVPASELRHIQKRDFLAELNDLYGRDSTPGDAAIELPIWPGIYDRLRDSLDDFGYRLRDAFGLGSSSIIIRVTDANLRTARALKIMRPRMDRFDRLLRLAEKERWRLNELRHRGLVRLFYGGELALPAGTFPVDAQLPYFMLSAMSPAPPANFLPLAPELEHASWNPDGCRRLRHARTIFEGSAISPVTAGSIPSAPRRSNVCEWRPEG